MLPCLRLACPERKSKDRFFARLASEFFLSSLQTEFFIELFRSAKRWSLSDFVTPSGALLTADCSLLTADRSLLTAYCLLL
jgi:hypothetical protein